MDGTDRVGPYRVRQVLGRDAAGIACVGEDRDGDIVELRVLPLVLARDEMALGRLAELAAAHGHVLERFQSNAEHELVERVQAASGQAVDFIIVNPAAFTHTSVALRDAFLASGIPFIEVHLSNIHRREAFRHHSYFSDIAVGVIAGLGPQGYELAFHAAVEQLGSDDD